MSNGLQLLALGAWARSAAALFLQLAFPVAAGSTHLATAACSPLALLCWLLVGAAPLFGHEDGECGASLGHAMARGPEAVAGWACSLLVWGVLAQCDGPASGRSRHSLEFRQRQERLLRQQIRQGIITEQIEALHISTVAAHLASLLEHTAVGDDVDVAFVAAVVRFLAASVARRVEAEGSWLSAGGQLAAAEVRRASTAGGGGDSSEGGGGGHTVYPGLMMPLHCGHNKNFTKLEKEGLLHMIRRVFPEIGDDAQL